MVRSTMRLVARREAVVLVALVVLLGSFISSDSFLDRQVAVHPHPQRQTLHATGAQTVRLGRQAVDGNLAVDLMATVVPFDPSGSRRPRLGRASEPVRKKQFIHLAARSIDVSVQPAERLQDGLRQPLLVSAQGRVTAAFRRSVIATGAQVIGYLPDDSLLVLSDRPTALAALPAVTWVGAYRAGDKISRALAKQVATNPLEQVTLNVIAFEDRAAVAETLGQLGGRVLEQAGDIIQVRLPGASLATVADDRRVAWLEEAAPFAVGNDVARGITGVTAIWSSPGLTGAGQTLALADTGLDTGVDNPNVNGDIHPDFDNRVTFFNWKGSSPDDTNGHGTHMAGIAAGSGAARTKYAGVAKDATLIFQGLGDDSGSINVYPPAFLYGLFQEAYDAGARVHSNSWTSTTQTIYTAQTRYVDQFMWDHPDALLVFNASNFGPTAGTIHAPANAKNCITVGASETNRSKKGAWADNPDQMTTFSSRGPTQDGRTKPDLVAPGTYIASTKSSRVGSDPFGWGSINNNYCYGGGTSQSAAHIGGLALLVRQYYTDIQAVTPSGALVKATLINGAHDMLAGADTDPAPNHEEGYGRADAVEAITPSAPRMVRFVDETTGLTTDESRNFAIQVSTNSELRLTLAWTDYMSLFGAAKHLINDLDLVVTAPDGTRYHGNDITAPYDDTTDALNNVERIVLALPAPGLYLVSITGRNVPEGPQPFAMALTGDATFLPTVGDTLAAQFAAAEATDRLLVTGDTIETVPTPGDTLTVLSVSSQVNETYGAGNVVDGDLTTRWTSGGGAVALGESLAVDFGSAVWINRVSIFSGTSDFSADTGNGQPTFTPTAFDIETSLDGTTWMVRRSVTGYLAKLGSWRCFAVPPVAARYLRLSAMQTTFYDQNGDGSSVGDAYYNTLGELKADYRREGTLVATTQTVNGFADEAGVDGDPRTLLAVGPADSAVGPLFATVDLGYERWVDRVTLDSGVQAYPTTGDGSPTFCPIDFEIRVSADNATWSTVQTVSGFNPAVGTRTAWGFPPVRARYLQVYMTRLKRFDANRDGVLDPGEKYYAALPELIVSSDRATVSSVSSQLNIEWAASMAADGNCSTAWASEGWLPGEQQIVTLDLKRLQPVDGIRLYSGDNRAIKSWAVEGNETFSPSDFTIESSTDGATWTERASVTGHAPPLHRWTSWNFAPVEARFLRLVITRAPTFDANHNGVADPGETRFACVAEMEPLGPNRQTVVSRTFDLLTATPLQSINWDAIVPAGSGIVAQVRSGNAPDLSAEPWGAEFTDPTVLNALTATVRYLQYRLRLTRPDDANTIIIQQVATAHN